MNSDGKSKVELKKWQRKNTDSGLKSSTNTNDNDELINNVADTFIIPEMCQRQQALKQIEKIYTQMKVQWDMKLENQSEESMRVDTPMA